MHVTHNECLRMQELGWYHGIEASSLSGAELSLRVGNETCQDKLRTAKGACAQKQYADWADRAKPATEEAKACEVHVS